MDAGVKTRLEKPSRLCHRLKRERHDTDLVRSYAFLLQRLTAPIRVDGDMIGQIALFAPSLSVGFWSCSRRASVV